MADEVPRTTHVTRRIIGFIKRPDDLLREMGRHPQLCCLFVTFLTSFILEYACSSKGKPVVVPARPPQLMFSTSSPVQDAPLGSLGPVIQMLQQEDIIVVLYYAPWCTKSRAARAEYLKAAHYFQKTVRFAAVNCWWPEGECRKRYKFLMFPVLMVYHTKLDGYRFSGVFRVEHIIKFVDNLLRPVSLVHSKEEIIELVARHDTVVFGYFNLSCESHIGAYRQFFYASMRIIEQDPIQPMRLAVVTHGDVANQLGLMEYENIVLFRITNTSMTYPYGKNITSSNIVRWALYNKGQGIVKRLSPQGVKSKALAMEINKGPALILFHKEDPLFDTELSLHMVKDLALLYNSCKIHPLVKKSRQTLVEMAERAVQKYQELSRWCGTVKPGTGGAGHKQKQTVHCCMSVVVQAANATSRVCSICGPRMNENSCGHISDVLLWLWGYRNSTNSSMGGQSQDPPPVSCCNMLLNYSATGRLSICCRQNSATDTFSDSKPPLHDGVAPSDSKPTLYDVAASSLSHDVSKECPSVSTQMERQDTDDKMERRRTDRYITEHLEVLPKRLCDRLNLERMQKVAPMPPSSLKMDPLLGVSSPTVNLFSSRACRTLSPLYFYSMDQLNYWMFSDVLGVELGKNRTGPAVVLVDKEREQHFVLEENVTLFNTLSFIVDYERGLLKRHQNSHSFHVSGGVEGDRMCVRELDSASFQRVVLEEGQDVALLLYSHWCGFCHTFSHTFLALAQYFSPSNITFARINGAVNDLPWQFTFNSYPVVMFFPANRKADSVVFPQHTTKSLPSLVKFILKHAQPLTCVLHAADMCSRDCVLRNLRRSQDLLLKLSRKSGRLQSRLQEISDATAAAKGQSLSDICDFSDESGTGGVGGSIAISRIDKTEGSNSRDNVLSDRKNGAGVGSPNYYSCLSVNYLRQRLQDTGKKVDSLQKVIQLLQASEGGPVSKTKLSQLMHRR